MNIKKEIGERIKRVRKQRGYTQEELAEIMEISSRNLSNIELGNSFPKTKLLFLRTVRLVVFFGFFVVFA